MPRSRHAESGRRQIGRGRVGPQQPTADGQRELLLGLELGSFWFCRKAAMRGSISGFKPGPISSSAMARAARSARCCTCGNKATQAVSMAFRLASNSLYCSCTWRTVCRISPVTSSGGELLEDLLHQGVLPGVPPQPQFIEHLLRRT